jgi:hypothetical protein
MRWFDRIRHGDPRVPGTTRKSRGATCRITRPRPAWGTVAPSGETTSPSVPDRRTSQVGAGSRRTIEDTRGSTPHAIQIPAFSRTRPGLIGLIRSDPGAPDADPVRPIGLRVATTRLAMADRSQPEIKAFRQGAAWASRRGRCHRKTHPIGFPTAASMRLAGAAPGRRRQRVSSSLRSFDLSVTARDRPKLAAFPTSAGNRPPSPTTSATAIAPSRRSCTISAIARPTLFPRRRVPEPDAARREQVAGPIEDLVGQDRTGIAAQLARPCTPTGWASGSAGSASSTPAPAITAPPRRSAPSRTWPGRRATAVVNRLGATRLTATLA